MARSPKQPSTQEAPQFDLAAYSFDVLLSLKKEIDSEVESRKAKEIEVLRAKVTESAQAWVCPSMICSDFPPTPVGARRSMHAANSLPSIAGRKGRNGAAGARRRAG